jgi:hypothetical protein
MVLPNLLHPLPTDVQSVNRNATIQDTGYNEPVQTVEYDATFTLPGQWKWMSDKELRAQDIGAVEYSTGYVLFRASDLRALGKTIKTGDRIIGYGAGAARVALDVYVTKLRYEGHYPDQHGPALVKAFFNDRAPERQKLGV